MKYKKLIKHLQSLGWRLSTEDPKSAMLVKLNGFAYDHVYINRVKHQTSLKVGKDTKNGKTLAKQTKKLLHKYEQSYNNSSYKIMYMVTYVSHDDWGSLDEFYLFIDELQAQEFLKALQDNHEDNPRLLCLPVNTHKKANNLIKAVRKHEN